MKRTVIGGILTLCGTITIASIIIAGAIYAPTLNGWSGKSRFWYAIFGSPTYGNQIDSSMNLGFPFIIGIIGLILGILTLGYEYFRK